MTHLNYMLQMSSQLQANDANIHCIHVRLFIRNLVCDLVGLNLGHDLDLNLGQLNSD